jgi:hypothetical protein
MELAIPLVALGGMYVISNQESNNRKNTIENYENINKQNNDIPENYPNLTQVSNENVKKYKNPNMVTDRYFTDGKMYQKNKNGPDQFGNTTKENNLTSLTGNTINKTDFQHNNMVPFFGSKIRGRTYDANQSESVLDNLNGTGSQQVKKQEVAPLFKPQKNIQYAYGTPNQSDFYQSRVIPSSNMANVKLWDEIKVAPGLNKGYTSSGSNGFNSGMESRDKWVDRNVDELRVKTNPKVSYGLENHEGPANYFIKNYATKETIGTVEKHLPDTYYVNTPDRWLTTTGLEKAQTARAIEVDKPVNRTTTTTEYFGADSNPDGTKMYAPNNYQQPKRPQLESNPVMNPTSRTAAPNENDYNKSSYKLLPNNRSCTKGPEMGGIGGAMKAAIAPLMDILRPSRKENVVGNCRQYGDAGTTVSKGVVYNPSDRAPTTMRETVEGALDMNHLNVQGQVDGAYYVTDHQSIENQRDTTNCSYIGNSGGSGAQTGNTTYNAAYNQRNNVNKTYKNRPNQGGMGLLNSNENIKIDKKDSDRNNNRMWVPNGGSNNVIPSMETYGKINVPQQYNENTNCDRINPDILNAFKKNPYTQSLQSY